MLRTSALGAGFALGVLACCGLADEALAQTVPVPAATAPTARSEALVRRYLAAIHFERMMDAVQEAMLPLVAEQEGVANKLTAEDQQMIVDIVRKLMREKFMPQ